MEGHTVAIIIFLGCSVPGSLSSDQTVVRYVDGANGRNTIACLGDSQPPLSCKTLDYACKNLRNVSTDIVVLPGVQTLSTSVSLNNLSYISITGHNHSVINCSMPNIGMQIVNVKNMTIRNLEFRYCGMLQNSTSISSHNESLTVSFSSALYFLNSTNIVIANAVIANSNGTGMTLFDTGGSILIDSVFFLNNKIPVDNVTVLRGGGGLYVELTSCTPGRVSDCASNPFVKNNHYTIRNCTFVGNVQSNLPNSATTFLSQHGPSWQRFGFGGGILLAVKGASSHNSFLVEHCKFTANKAHIGGGMSLIVDDQSKNNKFNMVSNEFAQNHAKHGGGGIEFGFFSVNGTKNTSVDFFDCQFVNNSAHYGGAVSFFTSRSSYSSRMDNFITFSSSLWMNNAALVGAAVVFFPENWVSLSSGYLPVPLFHDCKFDANTISYFLVKKAGNMAVESVDGAIIYSNTFSLNFSGDTTFQGNNGSSIHISVGDINVLENSSIKFQGNVARKGGALSLIGYASLIVHKKSSLRFLSNTALEIGGAIYYNSFDYMDVINSRHCFLRYSEVVPVSNWDTTIHFEKNTAKSYGHAIYATYLEACARASVTNVSKVYNMSEVFHWKSFSFKPPLGSEPHIITTDPVYLYLNQNHIQVSPGMVTDVPFVVKDGLNQTLQTVLYIACHENCRHGDVSTSYKFISNKKAMFEGDQNVSLTINAETTTSRLLKLELKVTVDYCPPGYYFENNTCHCSVLTSHELPGIVGCDKHTNRAQMQLGYWAGCTNISDDGGIVLATGQCPLGYCDFSYSSDSLVLLPSNCSLLSQSLCLPNNRKGLLCGECIDGFSVYYHSDRFKCGGCTNAAYGIPFYIISELLPCTILFIVIIVFDVSFTSGSVTSFILFAQVLDFFGTTAFGMYNVPIWLSYFIKAYKFMFGFFNLDFFKLDQLSFCLWENASALDVLAFKYVTTLYALFLVGVLFVLMHCCRCNVLKNCRQNEYGGYTVTNGLVAFITITYFQCAKVSFEILTRYRVRVDDNSLNYHDVVFLSGTTPFFSQQHLRYAIPAVLVLSYATIVPLVLIMHPLYAVCNKWLSNEHSKGVTMVQAPLCWRKIILYTKPVLDSFQYCFKDDMRVFAGLLFLYRLVVSASFAFTVTAASMYSLLELILVIMLTNHSLFQPYKKKAYNVIDTLMYADLVIINGISLYKVAANQTYDKSSHTEEVLATIQVILIYIPILYFFGFIVVKVFHSRGLLRRKTINDNVDFDPDTLPDRLLEEEQTAETKEQPMNVYGSVQFERATY